MYLIFSFDSEDPVTPEAADAEKWWADELSARGLRGSFQCVAEMLRSLRRWDRQDVVDSLARHELGYHGNYHSLPPTDAEALEVLTLEQGVDWMRRREASGLATHLETFGRPPVSYCQPGRVLVPAALLAMAAAGLTVCCGSPMGAVPSGRPFWYCGLLTVGYDLRLERYFRADEDAEAAGAAFVRDFEERVRAVGDEGLLVLFTHSARLVTGAFWDVQFYGGRHVAPARRRPAPLLAPGEVQENKDRARRWLDWIQRRADVRFTDFASLHAAHAHRRRDLSSLLDECGLGPGQEGRLPLRYDSLGTSASGAAASPPPKGSASGDPLSDAAFAALRYDWGPLPRGSASRRLRAQARGLAWTAAPAYRSS